MSTPRGPKTPFGNSPRAGSTTGAPLPLVTQPMIAIEAPDDHPATRTDNPLQGSAGVSAVFGKTTALSAPLPRPPIVPGGAGATMVSTAGAMGMPSTALAAQGPTAPTEIGLTQHHLPVDKDPDPRLALVIDPDSERAAAFRVLRHHLLEIGRPQVVVVSSPVQGEGKTTVALNLALALAECGRAKVLLVETHLRRPQLAGVFDLTPPWCFAEQLAAHRHQPMLPWSLVEIPSMWLHVAAINPANERPQLLDAPAFAIAMERLRLAGYEHIVIDAPPVLGSADVNLMADAADAVVFAVRSKMTTARNLRKAVDQLGTTKVVGSVLVTE
nr:hypothetical protein [Kofleriaceae bacterium]